MRKGVLVLPIISFFSALSALSLNALSPLLKDSLSGKCDTMVLVTGSISVPYRVVVCTGG